MRLLFYNWVDYLDDEARGGGVTIYQRNLIEALDRRGGVEAVFLSAGISYDLKQAQPRWEQVRHGPDRDRNRRYEIVNSGVMAPAHHSFGDPRQIDHPETEAVFFDFVERTGPYDAVHFNNLEGLPARVLAIKARWPRTRVILTLHNYYPVCPQVNLWRQERATCTDFEGGRACITCLPRRHDPRHLRLANALAYRLKCAGLRPGSRTFDTIFLNAMRVGRHISRLAGLLPRRRSGGRRPAEAAELLYAHRRAEMVRLINTHCDVVLCVSDAVRRVARHYGIAPGRLATSYIGTAEAGCFARTRPRDRFGAPDGTLRLAYLGYMRRDKGFHFLLDALEKLPPEIGSRVHLTVAARRGPPETMAQLHKVASGLAGLQHFDGYTHDDLDTILKRVDLGVVPVMWHDNLPQVAIEMHARHIPLLTSDMGGARELGRCPDLVFPAGDAEAFRDRLQAVLDGRVEPAAYWRNAMAPVDTQAHAEELLRFYSTAANAMPHKEAVLN
ncbi:glycosyltransferase [Rhodosalinus sp.]|uniref:glycosyltransferase n=1 Tax=Rhodosalinus sp. TaxID=2047741 RepID=UPI003978824D